MCFDRTNTVLLHPTDAWNYVMTWLDMMPIPAMVAVLEKSFFPRWHQVLCSWLASNPDYEEVTTWYTGWKTIIPEVLRSQPAIKGRSCAFYLV